jgi:uncharacterized membrane protein YbaN (DUF454 family)
MIMRRRRSTRLLGRSSGKIRIRAAAGKVRVEATPLFLDRDEDHIENLIRRLFQLPAVGTIDIDRSHQVVVIHYDPDILPVNAALRGFSDALRRQPCDSPLDHLLRKSRRPVKRVERRPGAAGDEFVVGFEPVDAGLRPARRQTGVYHERVRRLVYVAFGGGCFVMSVVGIMTPFVPTMPFVLATGYFLANSSPTLHDLFRRSPLFGEMLCDWEERGGWRMSTKRKLFALMAFVWGVTLLITGFSWQLVIIMGLMSGISVVMILRVPTIFDEEPPRKLITTTA